MSAPKSLAMRVCLTIASVCAAALIVLGMVVDASTATPQDAFYALWLVLCGCGLAIPCLHGWIDS